MKTFIAGILLFFGVAIEALGATSQTVPQFSLTSSNNTVLMVTNAPGLIVDLSAVVPASTNSGNWVAIGTNNATLNGTGGTAKADNGRFGTNYVGELQVTNNATILGTNFPVNIAAGRRNHFGPPTNAIAAQIFDVGVLTGTNYVYAYTEWDIYGNSTTLSALSPVYAVTNKSLWLQVPLPRAGTTYRNVYRTKATDTNFFLLCQFGGSWDHFQTIFVDNVADGSLGAIAPTTDTTIFENLVMKDGVKYMMTHPTNTGPADLTMLTSDPLTGTYSIDSYGEILARSVNRPVGAGSTPAFGAIVAGTGMGYRQYWVSETNDLGVTQPLEVYQIQGQGKVVGAGPFSISSPVIEDSVFNVGESHTLGITGLHSIARLTSAFYGSGNSIFFGGANTNFLASIGALAGNQFPFIGGYGYASGNSGAFTTAGNNPPSLITFDSSGAIVFSGGPSNNGAGNDATMTRLGAWWATGGLTVGTNTTAPGALNLKVDGTANIAGGITNGGASTFAGKMAIGSPSLTDATVSIGATNFLGLNGPLRVTGNGNNIFVGHGNTAYQGSIGAESGSGDFQILAYAYQTNSSLQAYSGGVNLPYREKFWTTGALSLDNAPLGTTGNAVTWTQRAYFSPLGGLRLDTSQVEPGAGALVTAGNITSPGTIFGSTLNGTTADFFNLTVTNGSVLAGGFNAQFGIITNDLALGTLHQGAVPILTAGQHLTNIVDVGSGSGVALSLSGTNVSVIGGLSADSSTATNGYNVPTIGKGLTVKAGANGKLSSTAETLSAGTVVVNNTSITANSKVFLQPTTVSPVSGVLAVTAKSVGTSFTVTSSNVGDTNQFSWFIVEAQ